VQWWNVKRYDTEAVVAYPISFAEASYPVYVSFLLVNSSLVSNIAPNASSSPARSPLVMNFMSEVKLKQAILLIAWDSIKGEYGR